MPIIKHLISRNPKSSVLRTDSHTDRID